LAVSQSVTIHPSKIGFANGEAPALQHWVLRMIRFKTMGWKVMKDVIFVLLLLLLVLLLLVLLVLLLLLLLLCASAPQSHGLVEATGCHKRRRRVKRHRGNTLAVPRQSRHTSRRRVVGGQQPQSHGHVPAAFCQKRRRRMKRRRVNRAAVLLQSRHTRRRRVVGGLPPWSQLP
jgi:competence protein ComGC